MKNKDDESVVKNSILDFTLNVIQHVELIQHVYLKRMPYEQLPKVELPVEERGKAGYGSV